MCLCVCVGAVGGCVGGGGVAGVLVVVAVLVCACACVRAGSYCGCGWGSGVGGGDDGGGGGRQAAQHTMGCNDKSEVVVHPIARAGAKSRSHLPEREAAGREQKAPESTLPSAGSKESTTASASRQRLV